MTFAFLLAEFVAIMAIPLYAVAIVLASAAIWMLAVWNEKNVASGFMLVVFGTLLCFALQFNPFTYMVYSVSNALITVSVIVAYLAIGILWGFTNWRLVFMSKISNALAFIEEDWKSHVATETAEWSKYPDRTRNPAVGSDKDKEQFITKKLREENVLEYGQTWPIQVRQHLGSIAFWMAYWPASVVNSILGDLLYTLYTRFILWISGTFQNIVAKQDAAIMDRINKI